MQGGETNLKEPELLRRISEGDHAAFTELYERCLGPLLRFVYRYTRSSDSAEDVVAELFISLWQNRENLRKVNNLGAHLYASARNRALNFLRSEHRKESAYEKYVQQIDAESELNGVERSGVISHTINNAIWDCIYSFDEPRRSIMMLSWDQKMGAEQIAQVLGISRSSVDKHIARALETIRNLFPPGSLS